MKTVYKKIFTVAMVIMLVVGTLNSSFTINIRANDFDGDLTENPFLHLFQDNGKPNTPVIDDEKENPTTNVIVVTKKDVVKALRISLKSATKQNKKSKKARIVLKKVTKLKGVRYQVKYATNKKFRNAKVKSFNKNKITLKKLKANRRYYIKARAYVKVKKSNRVYGKWTKRKMIKIKKKK